MSRLALLGAPLAFAWRRSVGRPLAAFGLVVSFAAAGGLIGFASLTAAVSQEQNVRRQLRELSPSARSIHVTLFMLPGEGDARTLGALTALRGFGDVAEPPRRVRVWHSLERNNPLGLRLV